MTATAALYNFFSSFGIPAYPSGTVIEIEQYPWLTYEVQISEFGEQPVGIGVNLYYHTDSEAIPNAKVQEIADRITRGGKIIRCDGGAIWIKKGSPWCTNLTDTEDQQLKRRFLNITLEYLT